MRAVEPLRHGVRLQLGQRDPGYVSASPARLRLNQVVPPKDDGAFVLRRVNAHLAVTVVVDGAEKCQEGRTVAFRSSMPLRKS